jgi:hypothetical protein
MFTVVVDTLDVPAPHAGTTDTIMSAHSMASPAHLLNPFLITVLSPLFLCIVPVETLDALLGKRLHIFGGRDDFSEETTFSVKRQHKKLPYARKLRDHTPF